MKVLFLSAANNIHTIRWVNSLVKNGIEVELVSLKSHSHLNTKNKIDERVKITYLPVDGTKGYFANFYYLRNFISKVKPDLINVHYASGYGTLGSFIKGPKKILNVWGSDVYDFPNESLFKRYLLKRNLKSYDKLASTSICMAKQVEKVLGRKVDIEITPFGVDIDLFKPLNTKKDKKVIGIVKTLAPKYGVIYLIEAFNLLYEKYKKENNQLYEKIYLEIYGIGPLKESLEEKIKQLGLEERILLKGYLENEKLPAVINTFSVFCVPSILDSESFGVAAVEAMACEIPVVVSDSEGLAEVVKDSETGYIVPKKNAYEIAEKIDLLLKNEQKASILGKLGRERVIQNYSWKENVEKMIKLYESMVSKYH